ncbi:MAG: BamA/TamA family outer membrane protein [Gammaproteobacteria bacterium]|nr:BamA/TamA family outer membrane protein [Gammaproteobacteria bacterium]
MREDNQPLGGNLLVTGGAELIFPVPFLKKTLKSFRLSAFADVGNVFDVDQSFDTNLLRYSVGVGAVWISPFGAMTVSFAQPFNQQTGDEEESFQFSLGSTF